MNKLFAPKILFTLLFLGLSAICFASSEDSLVYKEHFRHRGKVKIIKGYDPVTNKLVTKEKFKNDKRIYFIKFNEKGKVDMHINKKGQVKIHVPGCNC